ncbi:hypothetical protein STAFG_0220 [Streptomyces afghaniensis 772]|uniref:Uncharacterized protein n=1 Tax=Streptomyces afghaniensis 772 TaxID=1283301 RepID=S4N443_9ACTN|nr:MULTISPECIES: hypothetical protein [Streptomyces]EPJ42727.1 hypothetical protein STAFG_0220 [Streptomyces afghaniensis 772]UOB07686.1 hypothetical protein MQE23_00700 [Streptomyces sp. HP-A2021]
MTDPAVAQERLSWTAAGMEGLYGCLPDARLVPTQFVSGRNLLCAEKQLQHGVTG